MALTPVQNLYDAFLVLLESDEWDTWDITSVNQDLKQLAVAAKPWFKFPRVSLEWDANAVNFIDEKISNNEIQIWALYMKATWYARCIDSWENIRPYYTEKDFSPAKQLAEFRQRHESLFKSAAQLEARYYRSVNGKPFSYSQLAGGK